MNDSMTVLLNNVEVKSPFFNEAPQEPNNVSYFSTTSQVFPRAGIVTLMSTV